MRKPIVAKSQIKNSIKIAGIMPSDTLLIHSALSAIGYVEDGADAVIDAFCEVVGSNGTIVMSTLCSWEKPFDMNKTPSEVGVISETFRKRPNVVRSKHPVHSVAAWGRHAEFVVKDHEYCETGCGEGTPYDKLLDLGAKVLLLGVDMDRNTIMHSLEEAISARFLRTVDIPAPTYVNREIQKAWTLKKFPPGHRDFLQMSKVLREKGKLDLFTIGSAQVMMMNIADLFKEGLRVLSEDPLAFICNNPVCNSCHWSRRLYGFGMIDMKRYENNGCVDQNCEICVI